jgi:hypothetical protein
MTEKEEKTDSDYEQYAEFGGVVNLQIDVRLPNSYLEAVKAYCNLDKTPVREWFNNEILNLIESIEVGYATPNFVERFHLSGLSRDKKDAIIQHQRSFTSKDEKLSDV